MKDKSKINHELKARGLPQQGVITNAKNFYLMNYLVYLCKLLRVIYLQWQP